MKTVTKHLLIDKKIFDKVKIQGRYEILSNGVSLDWTVSTLEFCALCKGEVAVNLNTEIKNDVLSENNIYFTVYIDGVRQDQRVCVHGGKSKVILCSDVKKGTHIFSLVRQTEACMATVEAESIELDGELLDYSAKNKYIKFYGDSITVGMGNLGDKTITNTNGSSNSFYQDGSKAFAFLTAKRLGYDYSAFARTGIAVKYGYGYSETNNFNENVLNYYDMQNYYRSTTKKYTPNRQADIVCINLGTNDMWSGKCPSDEMLSDALVSLANKIRADDPKAKIVLICGGIIDKHSKAVSKAVEKLGGEANGYYYSFLPSGLTSGAQGHPSASEDVILADALVEFLASKKLVDIN